EFVIALISLPGRHYSIPCDIRDLFRALLDILVIEQRKRRDLARPVTGGAVVEDNRRDVSVECQSALGLRFRERIGLCADGRLLTLPPTEEETRADQDGERQKQLSFHKIDLPC